MKKRIVTGLIILLYAIAIVVGVKIFQVMSKTPIPNDIKKNISFMVFYPDHKKTGYSLVQDSFKYNPDSKVLLFNADSADNQLVITEQATPDPFNDIPQYWPSFTSELNSYTEFDSSDGKVALTRPAELKGGQSAVFNGKGTLMFIHPKKDLSDDEWRKLFNNLKIIK